MQIRLILASLVLTCGLTTGCGKMSANNGASASSPTPHGASAQAETQPGSSEGRPQQVGECVQTRVAAVGQRLQAPSDNGILTDVPNSGSSISFTDGLSQVDYDAVPGIDHSRAGDGVRLCLTSVPKGCPPGDNRGRVYAGTNLRTGESWNAMDSEHECGGA